VFQAAASALSCCVVLVIPNMKTYVIALSCFLAGTMPQEASAAFQIKHFPPCPEGVVDKKACECRAFVSTRFHICHPGQYCLRNAFHGMCLLAKLTGSRTLVKLSRSDGYLAGGPGDSSKATKPARKASAII
jgi:hypothetical protein